MERVVHTGTQPARPRHATRRARILLEADVDGPHPWPDERQLTTADARTKLKKLDPTAPLQ